MPISVTGFFGAIFAAYFVQNLFLFDTTVAYIVLFAVYAFFVSETSAGGNGGAAYASAVPAGRIIAIPIALAAVALLFYSLYAYHYVPYRQAKIFRNAVSADVTRVVLGKADSFLYPYNFLQPTLRFELLERVYGGRLLRSSEPEPLAELALSAMEEVVARNPGYEPRHYILLAESYNERGKVSSAFFEKSLEHAEQALLLSPKRQDIYYLMAFAYAGENRFEEAVETARKAVALNPKVGRAHYNLGIELALAGQEHWDEADKELGIAQDIGFVIAALGEEFKNIRTVYEKMLIVYVDMRDRDRVVRVAGRFRELDPELAGDMDTIINLAETGQWGVLDRLLAEASKR